MVASAIVIHREICQDAAVYFSPSSPEILADKVAEVIALFKCVMDLRSEDDSDRKTSRGVSTSTNYWL